MLRTSFLLIMMVIPSTAWMTGSSVSSFGGSVLITGHHSVEVRPTTVRSTDITMKKGKANVPPQMRSQYAKQQEMMAMREQMIAATKPGSDGFPVFNLFVRTKRANVCHYTQLLYRESNASLFCVSSFPFIPIISISPFLINFIVFPTILFCVDMNQMWYPCGSFKGDDRSAALAKSYADNGLLAGISKKQIDAGIAGSLYRDKSKLADSICRAYPQLRQSRDEFEFGYKLAYNGLTEAQAAEIKVIEPKETKGILDGIKNVFSS